MPDRALVTDLDTVPLDPQGQRELDAVLDALGVPRRPSADTGTDGEQT